MSDRQEKVCTDKLKATPARVTRLPWGALYQQDRGAAAWRGTDSPDVIVIIKREKGPQILIMDSNFEMSNEVAHSPINLH